MPNNRAWGRKSNFLNVILTSFAVIIQNPSIENRLSIINIQIYS